MLPEYPDPSGDDDSALSSARAYCARLTRVSRRAIALVAGLNVGVRIERRIGSIFGRSSAQSESSDMVTVAGVELSDMLSIQH